MKCSACGFSQSKVLESRITEGGSVIRRRRRCLRCARRFTTYERAQEMPLIVVKKDGTREAFDRLKIQMGMIKACEKRPISLDRIEQAVAQIEAELRDEPASEVSSATVGEKVMAKLLEMDDVAYVRFASVYKEFDDAKKFAEVLAVLSGGRRRRPASPQARRATQRETSNKALAVLNKGKHTTNRVTSSQQSKRKRSNNQSLQPKAKQ